MRRVFLKSTVFTLALMTLSTLNAANAIDTEYKNSLNKVELLKTGDSSYNVNLYTSKKFSEPVKVIKKSDLNYYILLPETKNLSAQTSINTQDIRNVNTKLYQYAGADVNNGYTKININTTKPINFNIAVKNSSQTAAKNNVTLAQSPANSVKSTNSATNTKTANNEAKAQKKNSDFQKTSKVENSSAQAANKARHNQTQNKIQNKKQNENSALKNIKKAVKNNAPKTTRTTAPKTTAPKTTTKAVAPKEAPKKEIKTEELKNSKNALKEENIEPSTENNVEQTTEQTEQNIEKDTQETTELSKEELEELERIAAIKKDNSFLSAAKTKAKSAKKYLLVIKTKLSIKLTEYGLTVRDIALMSLAGILSFIIMLVILTKKSPQPRLKSKADLFDKNDKNKLTPKKTKEDKKEQPKNGEYFIFDNNVRQTGFCDPATSAIKRNYELSSYDPDLRNNYKRAEIEPYNQKGKKAPESEYDIIQKILKEDSLIEIAPGEFEEATSSSIKPLSMTSPIRKKEIGQEKPTKQPTVEEVEKAMDQEPTVLSSVEIAPERGFMCVSYNDNISLVGYIFDDIFALHNFKSTKLENYDIKFRLSEKDDKSASFIVKVDKTKMLIKVTKSTMQLEVVM